jgi:hypothetical protein
VAVSIQPAAAVEVILFAAGAGGKLLTTTDTNGKGSFDSSRLANLGNLTINEETCKNLRRVLLVASGAKATQDRDCRTTQIGTFVVGKDVVLNARLSGSFTPAIGAVPIPEQTVAVPGAPAPTRVQAAPPPVTGATAGATACPAGAGLIGPKLDLPPGGNTFEESALLSACTYKGLEDAREWKYFKVSLANGQTLKATARTRDAMGGYFYLRLHGSNGGLVEEKYTSGASTIVEAAYKATESGFAYVAVRELVRDVAVQISIQ